VLDIEAIGRAGIQFQVKTQVDDEQRMFDEEAAQLGRGDKPLAYADQEGFEIGAFQMGWTSASRALRLPLLQLLNERPIKQRKEGVVVLHNRIMLEHTGQSGLVKDRRRRYHESELLSEKYGLDRLCKGVSSL